MTNSTIERAGLARASLDERPAHAESATLTAVIAGRGSVSRDGAPLSRAQALLSRGIDAREIAARLVEAGVSAQRRFEFAIAGIWVREA